MTYGLTSSGFIQKIFTEIQSDIGAYLLSNLDPALDLSPDRPLGQLIGACSKELSLPWEAINTIYNQMDPDAAEGDMLHALGALTGVRPQAATFGTCVCTLNLNAGASVPAGSVAYVSGQPSNTWTLDTTVSNGTMSPGNFTGNFTSTIAGPTIANSGTLTQIGTPVIGWNTVTNAADAVLGLAQDTDAAFRIKRQNSLAASGAGTVDAIRADVLNVEGVLQAFCFENTTDTVDGNGVPPHSDHVVIWDGASPLASNTAVAQAIWNSKPSGIATYGSVSANAIDSVGNTQVVKFDRATQVPIYFTLTTTLSATAPSNYRTLVKAALETYAVETLNLGIEVFALAFRSQALTVAGVLDVPTFFLGTAPSPGGTSNIPITFLQIATLDTSHILVDGS